MQLFSDIVGQEQVKEQLGRAIEYDRVSHAYIICGEKGCGKKTAARIFAAALQCEKGGTEPCRQCHSCKMADTDNHPDIITVRHEKPNTIAVSEIREQVVGDVLIKPYYGPKKIYIIPDAEKMNINAQNALLKTIEEPPAYAVIILLAENREMLLPTILSRCVSLMMKPVSDKLVQAYLVERCSVGNEDAPVYTAFARGNIGRAIRISQSEEFIQMKEDTINFLQRVGEADSSELIAMAKGMAAQKESIYDMLDLILLWYHDVLVSMAADEEGLTFVSETGYIEARALRCSYEGIEKIFEAVKAAKIQLKSNASAEICLELLFITIRDNS